MNRRETLSFEFVDLLPPTLLEGVVYISIEHCTVVHLCCSGCGERVVNNLSPAGWKLTYDGETISLDPSIGNGALSCNSHYWIKRNKVVWYPSLTKTQTHSSQLADRRDGVAHYSDVASPSGTIRRPWWRRLFRR